MHVRFMTVEKKKNKQDQMRSSGSLNKKKNFQRHYKGNVVDEKGSPMDVHSTTVKPLIPIHRKNS